MTVEDAPATTRRALRARPHSSVPTGGDTAFAETADFHLPARDDDAALTPIAVAAQALDASGAPMPGDAADSSSPAPDAEPAREPANVPASEPSPEPASEAEPADIAPASPTTAALAWVDTAALARTSAPSDLSTATTSYTSVGADLLTERPRRSLWRPSVVWPTLVAAVVAGAYAATTLLWPLHAVAPTVTPVTVDPLPSATVEMAWPEPGSSAVSVAGIPTTLASADAVVPMASITKVVTALVVLDRMPLAAGEQGPEYYFTAADSAEYWEYRYRDESALDVPVGGSLTEYQMLEGMLIGSANNYADRLASRIWPSDALFADAADTWLSQHGLTGITVVEPTGIDPGNTADAASLLALASRALADPIIAEIVAKTSVELPGAGLVENTNSLLADDGVVGVKTGTLDGSWNLLSAKDVVIGDTTVRLYGSVLGESDADGRDDASRSLYEQATAALQPEPSVTAGTVAGTVSTLWGSDVDIVVSDDASVILWDGGTATVDASYDLDDARDAGEVVGDMSVSGPLDAATVTLELADDIEDPSAWWRLTHPLDLFGLNG
ncbi:D-alanyl-D-alanine carboxypeptidase [Microbacterium aquimaris]|uniref:D-alanyl-D-alanine carboxypeptidase n=1 Tax=Microbacterium aquimaris TaxID=459816 RepID=UPI002AD39714|nr:D-alanyl-D-alanine carboxypeptidase [Microbacterium aquimaris]MDZ8275107.1 D-alanyl-D-alanine carboxypeptidase [Microbacterium aquimaris]